ncbi:MAG TPA: AI-2E family transporter [Firmicutes bacterium]|nr:AI-2E family transporter [Bacillota bacterium]
MFKSFYIDRKYIKIATLVLIVGILLLLTYRLSFHTDTILTSVKVALLNFLSIAAPVFYAFFLSYLLFRPLLFIQNSLLKVTKQKIHVKFARVLAILILVVLLIFSISLLFNLVFPPLFQNVQMLMDSLPVYQEKIYTWLENAASALTTEQLDGLTTWISNSFNVIASGILSFGTGVVTNLTSFVLNTVATIILTFYFLKDKERIFSTLNKIGFVLFKPTVHNQVKSFFIDLDKVFGGFIFGQLLDALFVGIASATLLLIIGHPFALMIGLVAGITNIIPYVGPLIGAALAFLLGLFTSINMAVLGFILLIAYQQIDGYFIQPKILGDNVGLDPVWIFIAILIGGSYFGALGMIISVPLVALIAVYFKRHYEKKLNR